MPSNNPADKPITDHNYAVQIHDLNFSYSKNQKNILNIPHWQISTGKKCFVQGSSGSGKSTLLNLLTGVLLPNKGIINILGKNITAMSNRQRDRFRANNIGVVFQQFNLIPYLSVFDNIVLAAKFSNEKKTFVTNKSLNHHITQLLASVKIDQQLFNQKAYQLSLGQQQRVAIVRALVNSPKLLIVDEPTSALDADNRDAFIELLMQVSTDATLIFVSHDAGLAKHFDQRIDLSQINLSSINPESSLAQEEIN